MLATLIKIYIHTSIVPQVLGMKRFEQRLSDPTSFPLFADIEDRISEVGGMSDGINIRCGNNISLVFDEG
jgi:hypothetical protein